jgi:hypothetical protein
MLFRAEEMIRSDVQIEINRVLPAEIAGLSTAEGLCRGEVVRAMTPEPPLILMNRFLAAKLLRYQFLQGAQQPPG